MNYQGFSKGVELKKGFMENFFIRIISIIKSLINI